MRILGQKTEKLFWSYLGHLLGERQKQMQIQGSFAPLRMTAKNKQVQMQRQRRGKARQGKYIQGYFALRDAGLRMAAKSRQRQMQAQGRGPLW